MYNMKQNRYFNYYLLFYESPYSERRVNVIVIKNFTVFFATIILIIQIPLTTLAFRKTIEHSHFNGQSSFVF